MRKLFMLLSAVAVVGCARGEEDIVADSPAAAALPTPLTFADFAGRWSIQLLGDMNDTVLTSFEMNATADGATWTLTPEGREPTRLMSMSFLH